MVLNKAQGNLLTKELCENSSEEAQVAGNIVSHGRWKRFHSGVDAKNSLQELQMWGVSYETQLQREAHKLHAHIEVFVNE